MEVNNSNILLDFEKRLIYVIFLRVVIIYAIVIYFLH